MLVKKKESDLLNPICLQFTVKLFFKGHKIHEDCVQLFK